MPLYTTIDCGCMTTVTPRFHHGKQYLDLPDYGYPIRYSNQFYSPVLSRHLPFLRIQISSFPGLPVERPHTP